MSKKFRFQRYIVCSSKENPWWATGVITIAKDLVHKKKVSSKDKVIINQIFKWFNLHIPCPPFQEKIASGDWDDSAVAWFRTNSAIKESVIKLQPLLQILRKHRQPIRVMRVNYPGRIRYSDKFQVVADTPYRTAKKFDLSLAKF